MSVSDTNGTTRAKSKTGAARKSTPAKTSRTRAPKTVSKAEPDGAVDVKQVESPIPPSMPAPVVVTETKALVLQPDLKKQELLAKVATQSGFPKRDVKPIVEALLAVLGEALNEGRDVNLNPMGKIVIKKSKPVNGGKVLTTRIRLKQGQETPQY